MEEKGVPNFTLEQAQELVDVHYGLTARAWSLPSYIDQNFKIRDMQGRLYVLKLANRFMDRDVLDFQHAAMIRLDLAGISVPTPLENAQREMITEVKSSAGESYLMHLVTWLPGHFVADIEPHSDTMLESLGHFLGKMDMAYQGFEHQAMDRDLIWDLRHALKVRPFLAHIDDLEDRKLVSGLLDRFEQVVIPNASLLRMSVIHNDANDYNVLTTRGCVSGVIDFGDQTRTWLVNELAIACAYMMLNKAETLKAALGVVRGYFEVF